MGFVRETGATRPSSAPSQEQRVRHDGRKSPALQSQTKERFVSVVGRSERYGRRRRRGPPLVLGIVMQ